MSSELNTCPPDHSFHECTVRVLLVEIEIVTSQKVTRLAAIEGVENFLILCFVCELNDLLVVRGVGRLEMIECLEAFETVLRNLDCVLVSSN